ncbi:MAG: hypothetical protein BWY09_00828 [Candidatus Hydrogenedentes bacterium ADurb.Bin179]|nr:MAG: hypothetical protein BWY09_00828 [Candidatus Hydrogenedentes bacterium ADurb.Bin179]
MDKITWLDIGPLGPPGIIQTGGEAGFSNAPPGDDAGGQFGSGFDVAQIVGDGEPDSVPTFVIAFDPVVIVVDGETQIQVCQPVMKADLGVIDPGPIPYVTLRAVGDIEGKSDAVMALVIGYCPLCGEPPHLHLHLLVIQ